MSSPFTTTDSVFADPQFANAGGRKISDYVPQKHPSVFERHQGKEIAWR
jgi:hypothetical protein